jgi:hypothetical protein
MLFGRADRSHPKSFTGSGLGDSTGVLYAGLLAALRPIRDGGVPRAHRVSERHDDSRRTTTK